MQLRRHRYVGPLALLDEGRGSPGGTPISSHKDLVRFHVSQRSEADDDDVLVATYIVDIDGTLVVAPRRSEHVVCARGGDVLAAGEIAFTHAGDVVGISNQSTGYCPDPDCWPAARDALLRAGVPSPPAFTSSFVFRRCPQCGERNLVKEAWFVCAVCDAELPAHWNFDDDA